MAKIKPAIPAPTDLQCGGMVANIKTGAIGWVIWPEDGAVAVEISFGTGRREWDVASWPLEDVVVPGSHSRPSRAAMDGTPAVPAREAHTPASPACSGEGDAGLAGPTDRPLPGAPDYGPVAPGSGRSTEGGRS